mmetsp:Transcript_28460/g.63312  ORF Transcript_28460/g.63312 Transcript_28460/m.63312 type:complete len:225 (-) Transcript_28460:777-1451(-)
MRRSDAVVVPTPLSLKTNIKDDTELGPVPSVVTFGGHNAMLAIFLANAFVVHGPPGSILPYAPVWIKHLIPNHGASGASSGIHPTVVGTETRPPLEPAEPILGNGTPDRLGLAILEHGGVVHVKRWRLGTSTATTLDGIGEGIHRHDIGRTLPNVMDDNLRPTDVQFLIKLEQRVIIISIPRLGRHPFHVGITPIIRGHYGTRRIITLHTAPRQSILRHCHADA